MERKRKVSKVVEKRPNDSNMMHVEPGKETIISIMSKAVEKRREMKE